ncbi:hypothetical protein NL676_038646 [Syzygium grande]|nr:hypothetical protein NL676_038646 [Syzygium grande]
MAAPAPGLAGSTTGAAGEKEIDLPPQVGNCSATLIFARQTGRNSDSTRTNDNHAPESQSLETNDKAHGVPG